MVTNQAERRKGELNVEGKGRKKRTIELNVAARGTSLPSDTRDTEAENTM